MLHLPIIEYRTINIISNFATSILIFK